MQLTEHIYLVASGDMGFSLTHPLDCHVYLVDGGEEAALIDAGAGLGTEDLLAGIRATGLDVSRIRWLLLTHPHADHAGGAAALREAMCGLRVATASEAAPWVSAADEHLTSLDFARQPFMAAFVKMKKEWPFGSYEDSIVASEKIVYNGGLNYAGTFDRIVRVGNDLGVLDFKTGTSLDDATRLQTEGYRQAANSMRHGGCPFFSKFGPITRRFAVLLKGDGTYRGPVEYDDEESEGDLFCR